MTRHDGAPVPRETTAVNGWMTRAIDDATARGLPELKPLLETLARSTQALRDADVVFAHPALQDQQLADAATGAEDAGPSGTSAADHDHGAR